MNTNIDITQQSYTLTGQDITFLHTRKIDTSYGAFSLTLSDSLLSLGKEYGVYVITAPNVTFKLNKNVTQVSFTLTGIAAILSKSNILVTTTRYYNIWNPTITTKRGRGINTTKVDFTTTLKDVVFSKILSIAPIVSDVSLTGIDVSFGAKVTANLVYGAFTLTRPDALFKSSWNINADSKVITLVGNNITIDRVLSVVQSSFLLTCQNSNFGRGLGTTQSVLVVTGIDSILTYNRFTYHSSVITNVGSFTLTGYSFTTNGREEFVPIILFWS